ncbi:MAG: hypothetical protein HY072_00575 [Deltaproteobacteria bacterium]|nr:hypothetical protein [Deltaproteobacteria bacterium]
MELDQLLQAKLKCLDQVIHISQSFATQLTTLEEDMLIQFENERDRKIKFLKLIDKKIQTFAAYLPKHLLTVELTNTIHHTLKRIEDKTNILLKIDDELIKGLSNKKENILISLKKNKEWKEKLIKFKSYGFINNNNGFDQKL